jgi:hypothetical protein
MTLLLGILLTTPICLQQWHVVVLNFTFRYSIQLLVPLNMTCWFPIFCDSSVPMSHMLATMNLQLLSSFCLRMRCLGNNRQRPRQNDAVMQSQNYYQTTTSYSSFFRTSPFSPCGDSALDGGYTCTSLV